MWGYVGKATTKPSVTKRTHSHTWRNDKATKFDDLGLSSTIRGSPKICPYLNMVSMALDMSFKLSMSPAILWESTMSRNSRKTRKSQKP